VERFRYNLPPTPNERGTQSANAERVSQERVEGNFPEIRFLGVFENLVYCVFLSASMLSF